MIWLLFALLVGAVWGLWFVELITWWHWWVALIATGIIAVVAGVVFIFKFVKGRRAASALEKAIAEQGQQQLKNARPERRAEIQALQKQILDGIQALKKSKLGGKKRGGGALYQLPWYAIIGPPGAGKTTAIKHSGLVFPYADTSIRGVGGTRNCDWWFTNEAILLDTAGRYATEQEDQQEWIAFLSMLLKYRSNKPLNGLILAVSVPDIIDANEQQIELMGKKLRARIDEVMTKLRMILPVYLVVTKSDLVSGFIEFFGDLRKSDRAQAWGATIKLGENKNDPGGIFQREFDQLVGHLHSRAIRRLARERNREAREKIFQFPLEFAGIKRNLSELISQVFMVNTFQGTPLLRGVYFTSGTQEGRPLDRVLGRMGQAMGIQMPEQAAQQTKDSKSYFLHDVFMHIVFPDADVAARSASEKRRQRVVRLSVSAVAMGLAVLMAIPSTISFFKNREYLDESQRLAKKASKLTWVGSDPISDKLDVLNPLLERLEDLESHEADSPPLGMRWLMYSGDQVYKPLLRVYIANMQQGFVKPCKYQLESQLRGIKGEQYLKERHDLKTYLMLSDIEHLDVEWATGQYTAIWAEVLRPTSTIGEVELKKKIRPHIAYYLKILKAKKFKAVPPNEKIVDQSRQALADVAVHKRYYAQFVDVLNTVKYDPAGDESRSNKMFPPVTLEMLFTDRPQVLKDKILTSKQFEEKETWYEVGGPYTERGHYAVLAHIKDGAAILEREAWVVPLNADERGEKVGKNLKRLADDYEQNYISAWKNFMLDVKVSAPANIPAAIELYKVIGDAPWPFLRVLRALEDHTQWKRDFKGAGNDKNTKLANKKLNEYITKKTSLRLNIDVKKIAGRVSKVPAQFRKTVSFGRPQGKKANTPVTQTPLAGYIELLATLRNEMQKVTDKQPNAPVARFALVLQKAIKETAAMVTPLDDMARVTLLPMLQTPLNVDGQMRLTPVHGLGASGGR